MTALPRPDHLLTLDEWDELPEDQIGRSELVDGVLVMTPSAGSDHQTVVKRLSRVLDAAFDGAGLETVPDIDVALVAAFPPLVRRPDLVGVPQAVLRSHPKRFVAEDVVLAIEVVSPGSVRVDRMHKLAEYAEAGIPHYWIVDIEDEPHLTAYTLVDGAYETVAEGDGVVELTDPAPVTIDLAALLP